MKLRYFTQWDESQSYKKYPKVVPSLSIWLCSFELLILKLLILGVYKLLKNSKNCDLNAVTKSSNTLPKVWQVSYSILIYCKQEVSKCRGFQCLIPWKLQIPWNCYDSGYKPALNQAVTAQSVVSRLCKSSNTLKTTKRVKSLRYQLQTGLESSSHCPKCGEWPM